MQLELKFFATFREVVGSKLLDREYAGDEVTVREVLVDLEDAYADLRGQLLDDGDLRSQISVLKNGREVLHMDGLDTRLADGDTLAVFPPVAGGADGRGR